MTWLLVLLLGSTAHADDRARELFQNGRDLYNQGRYEAAITAWAEAYELDARPVLLFNLANAYERVGRLEEALEALLGYRPYAPAEEGDLLDARIRTMEERVAVIRSERRQEEQAKLEAERELAEEREAAAAALAEAQAAADAGPAVPVLPIAITAVGVGALGFGAVNGVITSRTRRDLSDPALCTPAGLCKTGAEDLFAREKRTALFADVGLISGAALTGLGVVLFALPKDESSDLQVVPRLDRAGLEVFGAF